MNQYFNKKEPQAFSVYFSRKGPWQPPAFRAFFRAAAPSYQHQQIKLKS
jgi:hypothetical protein